MNPVIISKVLQKKYFMQIVFAAILIIGADTFKTLLNLNDTSVDQTFMIVIATLAGMTAFAAPVFYRSYFIHKIKDKKKITLEQFIIFERKLISIALMTPYFIIVSILLNLNQTTNILITLFALYAAYFYFPSEKKVRFEMKVFRIKPIK